MKTKLLKPLQITTLSLLLIGSSVAYSQEKNNQQLSSDVTALQQSYGEIKRDMKKLSRLLDNRAMLELFQRMDELGDEVSSLRGILEQQNHDLAGLKKRQRELYLDTDRRLRELEITASRAPASSSQSVMATKEPAKQVATSEPASSTQPVIAVTKPPIQQVATAVMTTRPATISSKSKPSVTISEERAAYQKAFDMLKEGRYKMANASFKGFLGRFPQSSYAGNSQYWLGESNYVTRHFEQAVKDFNLVITNYPVSNKVPDAMLKLGYTFYELRNFEDAKSVLNKLRKVYPKSTAARLAGKRLERMKKEGL